MNTGKETADVNLLFTWAVCSFTHLFLSISYNEVSSLYKLSFLDILIDVCEEF